MTRARKLTPEFEHDLIRDPCLGYEETGADEFVRCIEHGSPTPLERWHCHDEYELQLIVGARGQAFVGDYVGHFEPGHLVLTGPRLPHNWVSSGLPPSGLQVRSLVIQFREAPLREGMRIIKELEEVQPLLDRARHGVEFFGLSDIVRDRFCCIRQSHGLERFVEFIRLLGILQNWSDYRLLSSSALDTGRGETRSTINAIVEYVNGHYAEPLSIAAAAARVNMTESRFSRYFNRETGDTFGSFVNRVRVRKACELLMHTDQQISSICYAVGFNNIANFNRRFRECKGMTPTEFRGRRAAGSGTRMLAVNHGEALRH
jgi:AraC-like DNA-binding protein